MARGRTGRPKLDTADPVDIQVGMRIRERRADLGWSQAALGDRVGVSFQQVQKYESGATPLSAGRLFRFAQHLGVDPQYFFPTEPAAATPPASAEDEAVHDLETRDLLDAYGAIACDKRRRALRTLTRALTT